MEPAGVGIVSTRVGADARLNDELRSAMNFWQILVLELDTIDTVTTELVRVRAAKHHDCHT